MNLRMLRLGLLLLLPAYAGGAASPPALAHDAASVLPPPSTAPVAGRDDRSPLDQARALAWRGEYAGALRALDAEGGDDAAARALRARVLAWAHRHKAALALNTPLYESSAADYGVAWTQALALSQTYLPAEALAPLQRAQALQPDAQGTRLLARVVRLPLFSSVGAGGSLYADSDDIAIHQRQAAVDLRLGDRWTFTADAARRDISADPGSAFAPLAGGTTAAERSATAGLDYAVSADTRVGLRAGSSRVDALGSSTVGSTYIQQYLGDQLAWTLDFTRARLAVSPRALAVLGNTTSLRAIWRPTLADTLDATLDHSNLSDGNQQNLLQAIYRHRVYSSVDALVDVGAIADLQQFSHGTIYGYYSPSFYRRFEPMVSGYFSLHPGVGLYLSAALGAQRDDTFRSWKRAADLNAELTVGIYGHWQLVGWAAWSQRLNQLGQYHAYSVGLDLRYRFCAFTASRCPRP